jgi:LacI family transcriptional regulator
MKKAATLREIAHRANIHYATVSTILNGSKSSTRVSEETRRRVLAIAGELGYSANRAAQQLRTRRSRVVGLLTGGLENPFFARMVSLCSEYLEQEGYDAILATRRRDEASDLHLFDTLVSRQVDGILLWSETDTQVGERIAAEPELAARVVVMGLDIPAYDCAAAGLYDGVRAALDHLREQGCARIGYFAPEVALFRRGDPRHDVYQQTMGEWGTPPRVYSFDGTAYDVAAARARAEALGAEMLALPPAERPDALLCLNDMVAFGAMTGLRRCGLRVPEDVAIVGCDDLPLASQLDIPLTTVAYPLHEVCRAAVRMLLERVNPACPDDDLPPPGRLAQFEAELVVRESSRRGGRPPVMVPTGTGKERE